MTSAQRTVLIRFKNGDTLESQSRGTIAWSNGDTERGPFLSNMIARKWIETRWNDENQRQVWTITPAGMAALEGANGKTNK